ncbi:MAG: MFS transporter [Pseudomonadota bacterium]
MLILLAMCSALSVTVGSSLVTVSVLSGKILASPALMTLPLGVHYLTIAASMFVLNMAMARWGRKPIYLIGALFCVAGGCLAAFAMMQSSFALLVFSSFLLGIFAATAHTYRFALIDKAAVEDHPRLISLVLAGGLIAAFLGPQLSHLSHDLLAQIFAGTYVMIAGVGVLTFALMSFAQFVPPPKPDPPRDVRDLRCIITHPLFITALVCGMVSYGAMTGLMGVTPHAMHSYGHGLHSSALTIQWHVVAMFAPSFFFGLLVKRLGLMTVLLVGAGFYILCTVILWFSHAVMSFHIALVALGIGWNFLYTGGTTLLARCYRPAERFFCQGINDTFVFASSGLTALFSGAFLVWFGWQAFIALVAILGILAAGVVLIGSRLGRVPSTS